MLQTANLKNKLKAVPLHYQVFLALLVMLSTVLPLTLTGCGNGESGASSAAANAGKTAALMIKFNSPDYDKINLQCKNYSFTFYDQNKAEVCQRSLQRRSFNDEGVAEIKNLPLSSAVMLGVITDNNNAPLALIEPHELSLSAGQTAETQIDAILTGSDRLSECLTDLRLTAKKKCVALTEGRKMYVSAKGVFSFEGYEGIECNLSQAKSLTWRSSDETIVKTCGKGFFQAVKAGEAEVSAVMGVHEKSLKVTVQAKADGTDSEDSDDEPYILEPDPESVEEAENPEPVKPEIEEAAYLQLNLKALPTGSSYLVRVYDSSNRLRLAKSELTDLNPSFEVDASATQIGGLVKSSAGDIIGLFNEEVALTNGQTLEVTPEILTGEALAVRGHLNITTDQDAYDFYTYEVYRKGFVSVRCQGEFGYSVIPGVWEYEVIGDFFENLASFDDEELDEDDSSVFRFFGPGTHTVNVIYKGVSASFTVIVVGPDEPVEIVFFKPDASLGAVSGFKSYELQGFANDGTETFTRQFTPADLNSEGKLSLADQGVTTDTKSMSLFAVSNDNKISLSEYKQLLIPGKMNLVSKAYETKSDEVLRQSLKSLSCYGPIWGYVGEELTFHIYAKFMNGYSRTVEVTSLVEWKNDYEEYIQCIDPEHGRFKVVKEYKYVSGTDYNAKIYASFANLQYEQTVSCWSSDNVDIYSLDVDISGIEHPADSSVMIAVEDLENKKLLRTSETHLLCGGSYYTDLKFTYPIVVNKNEESSHCRIYALIFDRAGQYLNNAVCNDVFLEKGKDCILDCSPSKIESASRFMKLSSGSFEDDAINDVTGSLGYSSASLVKGFKLWYFIPLSSGKRQEIWIPEELSFWNGGMFAPASYIYRVYPERIHTEFSNPGMFSFEFDEYWFEAPGESKAKYVYTQPNGVAVKSQEFTIRVAEFNYANCVEINYDASTMPSGASTVEYSFLANGWLDTCESIIRNYDDTTFENIADIASYVTCFVYNSKHRIVGITDAYMKFNNGSCVLNNVKIKSGTDMAQYLDSDEDGPAFVIEQENLTANAGEGFQASAYLRLYIGRGIFEYDNLTREVEWSCADDGIEPGGVPGSFIARKAGEHKIRAHFAGVTAEATVKVSGSGCYYGSADLQNKRSVSIVTYTPDSMVSGSAQATVTGGHKAAYSISRDEVVTSRLSAGTGRKQVRYDHCSGKRFESFIKEQKQLKLKNKSLKSAASGSSSIDYVNAGLGSVIPNLYGSDINDQDYKFAAKVIVSNNGDNFSQFGNFTRSGRLIILSEMVNGKPVIDCQNDENYKLVYLLDRIMGVNNPYDKDNMAILDRLHATWGHEYGYGISGSEKGGLDGTEKLIIVLLDGNKLEDENSYIAGYFYGRDALPRNEYQYSNEAEVLYLNASKLINDLPETCATAAHELQHCINFNMHYCHDGLFNGDTSYIDLNEGCSCLSSLLCGFGLDQKDFSGLIYDPSENLTIADTFFSNSRLYNVKDHYTNLKIPGIGISLAYGGDFVFMSYIYDRFGVEALQAYLRNDRKTLGLKDDFEVLTYAVRQTSGQNLSFAQIFADFGKACLLSGSDVSGNIPAKYRMTTIAPGSIHSIYGREISLSNVAPRTLELDSANSLTMLPWTNNCYITPSLTYGSNEEHGSLLCFNLGSLKNIFRMMLFDNSFRYEGDLN